MVTPKIAIVGEAWGAEEEKLQHAFVGASGLELIRMLIEAEILIPTDYDKMLLQNYYRMNPSPLPLLWAAHPEIALFNVFNLRPEKNDIETLCCSAKDPANAGLPPLRAGKYLRREYGAHRAALLSNLQNLRPNLVVALGNTATWALLSNSGIRKIRGTVAPSVTVPGLKVLPTYHPAAILRQWELRHVTVLDLVKAKHEAEFPDLRRPCREIWVEPTLDDIRKFIDLHLRSAKVIAPDIETAGDQITCIGFAASREHAIVIPFVDYRKPGGSYWPTLDDEVLAWGLVQEILNLPAVKVFQNGMYDINFLWTQYGIAVVNADEDTMLLHHSLQPESPKALDFLGSVYTNEPAWKLYRPRGKHTIKQND